MSDTDKSAEPSSLGELFKALRAGAPCPWCGEELHGVSASSLRTAHEQEGSECEDQNVLWCPGCGAEVQECPRRGSATNDSRLGAAA